MSDTKAAKLEAARRKLKDYQDKKNAKTECGNDFNNSEQHSLPGLNEDMNVTVPVYDANDIAAKRETFELNQSHKNNDNLQPIISENLNIQQGHVMAIEILVAEKQNLESRVLFLENSLQKLQDSYMNTTSELNVSKNKTMKTESDLKDSKENIKYLNNELESMKSIVENSKINENKILTVKMELEEKLDEALSELTLRKSENSSLLSQLNQLQKELDMTQLRIQLLTNGTTEKDNLADPESTEIDSTALVDHNKVLQKKISTLEQQVNAFLNEKEQLVTQYQHYIQQLNQQIESITFQYKTKETECDSLVNREASLIDQISQMEIRIQALQNHISVMEKTDNTCEKSDNSNTEELNRLNTEYEANKLKLQSMEKEFLILKDELSENEKKIIDLTETIESLQRDQPDLTKLIAANESDKVAAQRATAQNTKLKEEMQGLQDAFLATNNDKLELTEKLQAEKFLNRELTIKLSESEALLREVQNKLKAKDEEMIRLQSNCSQLEKQLLLQSQDIDRLRHYEVAHSTEGFLGEQLKRAEEQIVKLKNELKCSANSEQTEKSNCIEIQSDSTEIVTKEPVATDNNLNIIHTEEAMMKLQERFLKTMSELAELSDEKQNLEHIVLQLQGETETICEYIALYQQQRGILKKREEERIAQLKFMAAERERMQKQLEELQRLITESQRSIISRPDNQIKLENVDKMVNLVSEIKQSHLVDPNKQCSNLDNFHPCPWCSGKLIDV